MAREKRTTTTVRDVNEVVSVIGPGMEITGDIKCDGTVRVEGKVEGSIRATKSVVVGQTGSVTGDIETQDVVVGGAVTGTVVGASRVELHDTCRVRGDIQSRRIKLDEGGHVEGRLHMGKGAKATGQVRSASIEPPEGRRPEQQSRRSSLPASAARS